MAVIAIDLGTTSCKAAVFVGSLMLGSAYRHYSYTSPVEGWAEQDAEAVWELVDAVVKETLRAIPALPSIQAVCVSVQGDAIIPIDVSGTALHPAVLGMDIRSYREAADLQEKFGRGQLYSSTGMPCEPLNAITKIFWLRRHRPELNGRVWKYVHYEEFLLMRLAGVPALDFSMASRTMAFDPVRKDWVGPILEFVGITPSQLGNLTPSGAPIGIIRRCVASDWGIDVKALVVAGGHDQCMAAIGAGVIEADMACYSMGTAEVISTCFGSPRMTPAMLESNYPCYCHAVKDQYFTITLNQSGGLSLEWFQNSIMELGGLSDHDWNRTYDELISRLKLEPSPVLFLPHIVGSGTPTCDHMSRGTFLGLSLKSTRTEMFQAVVESLAFEARLNLDQLENLGIDVHELRGVGGGSRSRAILELKATVLNQPICTLKNPRAALLGTALLSQVAAGQFPDLSAACREGVQIDQTVEPVAEAAERYASAFERYRQLYGTLRSFYHNWRAECATTVTV